MKKVRIKVKNVIIASIIFVLIIVNIGLGIFFLGLNLRNMSDLFCVR